MTIRQFTNPAEFEAHVRPLLLRDECENCVPIGMLGRLAEGKLGVLSDAAAPPLLLAVEDDAGNAIAVASQTPPAGMLVVRAPPEALELIATKLADLNWSGKMNGPTDTIDLLAARYAERGGRNGRPDMELRLMMAERVIAPPPAPGHFRPTTLADIDAATRFVDDFSREIGEPHRDPRAAATTLITENRHFLWIDDEGQPRSMAAFAGPTPNGVRINYVYTPREFRGRGYASNVTAALTQHLLSGGRRFCFLFTDLANPTSNKIYEQIGYRFVTDFHNWIFDGAEENAGARNGDA